ncbi:MAG TPA: ribonuclease P protein component [Hyphomicrobium sp.]|nr:ribonuclease P protein component [Hyphomicrobium sp.]
MGLPRSHRLRSAREIRVVLKQGQRVSDSLLTIHARPNGLPQPRLALAVSRKVSPKAVVRNRLKRLIRESFRHGQGGLAGLDVVVVPRPTAVGVDPTQLRNSLESLWPAIRKRCNAPSSP